MSWSWEEQWALHAPGFKEGRLPVDLREKGATCTLYLIPGSGFGDLSHPTTQLMVESLSENIAGQTVVDIGSGSGILSFVAAAFRASKVVGIEIEHESLVHAQKNLELNPSCNQVEFYHPDEAKGLNISSGWALMNMILSEQAVALKSLPFMENFQGHLLISGVLEEQEAQAISRYNTLGWQICSVKSKDGWIALHFRR